ncbi:MAG: hypothetical protein FGM50_08680 [Mycobacterium sp.]|nr:hypothetical protein [Mycobacterium sp.]
MTHSVNTGYAVIVLGDRETVEREDLAEKAADQGAVIAEVYSFDPGEAASNEDLGDVEAVVGALSRAIASRTNVWVPFPFPDFVREQHVRRISLVLQRHGLNMLMGRDLEPCTTDGGFNPVDFALRSEVQAVDLLDNAVVASAGIATLEAEIEQALAAAPAMVAPPECPPVSPSPADIAVGEKFYSTGEVARFFGKSAQWVYWGMREGVFTYPDGSVIEPVRIGKSGRRRFTVAVMCDMARACYRRGILSEDELLNLLSALSCEDGQR